MQNNISVETYLTTGKTELYESNKAALYNGMLVYGVFKQSEDTFLILLDCVGGIKPVLVQGSTELELVNKSYHMLFTLQAETISKPGLSSYLGGGSVSKNLVTGYMRVPYSNVMMKCVLSPLKPDDTDPDDMVTYTNTTLEVCNVKAGTYKWERMIYTMKAMHDIAEKFQGVAWFI